MYGFTLGFGRKWAERAEKYLKSTLRHSPKESDLENGTFPPNPPKVGFTLRNE